MPNERSCFYCLNASISPGFMGGRDEPPEPPMAECQRKDVPAEVLELPEEEAARKCGRFNPRLIAICGECGIKMGVPEHRWQIWAQCMDAVACCSPLCRARLQHKFDKEMGVYPGC